MPVEPESLSLGAEFPTPTRDEWRELVSAVLAKSGAGGDVDPEDALSYTTYDDIVVRPLYTADDAHDLDADGEPGRSPFVRGATADGSAASGWDVCARHVDADAARCNRAILDDLERGATSLWLVLGDGGIAVDDLPAVLAGVYLDLAPIVLDASGDPEAGLRALLELAGDRDVDPGCLTGSIGADPIGRYARTAAPADLAQLAALADQRQAAPQLRIATVDATVYHDAGASDAQELGIATAVGVAYLRALTDGGLPLVEALAAVDFRFAVTAEQFPSIAKLRAARRMWDRVAQLCGASDEGRGQRQHAVTSAAMLTRRDPWVNLLRATIGCFAAAVGGAESVTVLPFDAAIGVSDDFARRIARNTHAVLHDESSIARVVDAAGGSWFVESLTDELAERAWTVFTSIEAAGGPLAALADGTIGEWLGSTRKRRDDDIAHRRAPITGVSEFADVAEKPVTRASLPTSDTAGAPLPRIRYAQHFEALRDRADARIAETGERPKVFLAGLGPLAAYSARAGFAANLLQGGGLECVRGGAATDELAALVTEFEQSGTTVACLCSTDRIYAEAAAPAVKALRDAGATQVWLAGQVDTVGVDGYLYVGCDALAALRSVFETLGVT